MLLEGDKKPMFTHTFFIGKMENKKSNVFFKKALYYISCHNPWPDLAFKLCLLKLIFLLFPPTKRCFLNSPPPLSTLLRLFVPLHAPFCFPFVLHHRHPQIIIISISYGSVFLPPPIFLYFCAPFFLNLVHCVCLVDRVRVIVDKTSGINEIEKRKK
jgi:hypothetical protein